MFALLRLCRLPNARVQVVREGGRVDCEKKPQKRKREKLSTIEGKKEGKIFRHFFSPDREKGLVIKSRLEDSFVWKPLYATKKEKKTHLCAKNKEKRREEKRERDGKRTREREIFRRRRPKLDGFGKTRRHSKAFAGGARGERHRDRGETRWDGVRDLSFVFFVLGGRVAHPARVSIVFFWVWFRGG